MILPKLKRHDNVHWVKDRRSARASTGRSDVRGAVLFYADWLKLNVDLLASPKRFTKAPRQPQKVQAAE
ncbi:hypothetical protein ACLBWX_10150 [Methylobacterium sp. M6A4_1b]